MRVIRSNKLHTLFNFNLCYLNSNDQDVDDEDENSNDDDDDDDDSFDYYEGNNPKTEMNTHYFKSEMNYKCYKNNDTKKLVSTIYISHITHFNNIIHRIFPSYFSQPFDRKIVCLYYLYFDLYLYLLDTHICICICLIHITRKTKTTVFLFLFSRLLGLLRFFCIFAAFPETMVFEDISLLNWVEIIIK